MARKENLRKIDFYPDEEAWEILQLLPNRSRNATLNSLVKMALGNNVDVAMNAQSDLVEILHRNNSTSTSTHAISYSDTAIKHYNVLKTLCDLHRVSLNDYAAKYCTHVFWQELRRQELDPDLASIHDPRVQSAFFNALGRMRFWESNLSQEFLGMSTDSAVPSESIAWDALYDAHVLFIKELYTVRASLDIFKIVGLNTNSIKGPGAEFLRFSSLLSQKAIVLGIESLFERTNDGSGLCSVRGLLSLARFVPLKDTEAPKAFVSKYGITPTTNWLADIEKVLEKQRPVVAACTRLTSKIRNQRMAHLAQLHPDAKPHMLPGVDACEQVIQFAYDFYLFIATGFLHSAGADLTKRVGTSLFSLLKKRFEIDGALQDFPGEGEMQHAPEPRLSPAAQLDDF